MANFTGLGQGFGEGMRTGAAIGAGIQNRGLEKAQAEAAMREKRTESDMSLLTSSLDQIGAQAKELIGSGAPREGVIKALAPQLQAIKKNAQMLGQIRGRDTSQIMTAADTIQRVIERSPTPTETARAAGAAGATEELSKASALAPAIGADAAISTVSGVQQTRQLALDARVRTAPNVDNFMMPDGTMEGIDNKAPGAAATVQDVLGRGGVRVGLNVQSPSAPGLGISGSETKDFFNAEVAAMNTMDMLDRMEQQLANVDVKTSFAGGVVRGIQSIAGNIRQLTQVSGGTAEVGGVQADEASLLDPRNYNLTGFGDAAAASAAFKTNAITLAYIRARSLDPSGRVSDRDVQNMLDAIATNSGDKGQISASLAEVRMSVRGAYMNLRTSTENRGVKLPPMPGAFSDKGDKEGAAKPVASAPLTAEQRAVVEEMASRPAESYTKEELDKFSPEQVQLLLKMTGGPK